VQFSATLTLPQTVRGTGEELRVIGPHRASFTALRLRQNQVVPALVAPADRPLTDREMSTLRNYSSRATITSTRFVNRYSYGSFKGNASEWMDKYFDAFLYLANWGTHELMLRLPRGALDLETAQRYLMGDAASARAKGDAVLYFLSEQEGSGWVEDEEGSGWMSSVITVRAELASGDLRVLYLGWLLCVQAQVLDEDALDPPVPAGVDRLRGCESIGNRQ